MTKPDRPQTSGGLSGYAYAVRDPDTGREILALTTFGVSKTKAKKALLSLQNRRIDARKSAMEVLNVCAINVQITEGQPPRDNLFVAPGCELFAT